MNKMTPWFPPHIKPVHKGVYPIKFTAAESYPFMYATWNGLKWSCSSYKKSDNWHKKFYAADQNKFWCGFTKEQK